MQSVRDNTAKSCDKSAEITNLLPSSHSEIHINCLYSESNQNHTDIQTFLLKQWLQDGDYLQNDIGAWQPCCYLGIQPEYSWQSPIAERCFADKLRSPYRLTQTDQCLGSRSAFIKETANFCHNLSWTEVVWGPVASYQATCEITLQSKVMAHRLSTQGPKEKKLNANTDFSFLQRGCRSIFTLVSPRHKLLICMQSIILL